MLRALLPLSLALAAPPALAQDWATAEVCTVETPAIHAEVFAPNSLEALQAEAARIPNPLGRFWRVTAPGGAVSHLWGTFHSTDPLILNLPDQTKDEIAAARVVAIEIDYIAKSREQLRATLMFEGRFQDASDPFAFTPGDGTVAGLSPEVSEWVRDRAYELGWTEDFDLVLSLPGIAEMLLSDPCEDFAEGILPIQDVYVQLLGRLAGARILGLEHSDEFISDLNADPDLAGAIIASYAAYLRPMTTNADRATSFAIYLEGRLGLAQAWDYAFQREIHGPEGAQTLARTDDYLLDFRNRRFLERLSGELTEGGVFLAVGSAHLPGEDGLVELLRARGYTVDRIPLPGEAQ